MRTSIVEVVGFFFSFPFFFFFFFAFGEGTLWNHLVTDGIIRNYSSFLNNFVGSKLAVGALMSRKSCLEKCIWKRVD